MKLYDVLTSIMNTISAIKQVPSVSSSTNGKFLKSNDSSYSWETVEALPTGGNVGDLLKKTSSGAEWGNEDATISAIVTTYMETHYENGTDKEY